jgi:hypothetical protein
MGTLHEVQYIYIISRSILLRTRSFSDILLDKIKTHRYVRQLCFENRAVYKIMWKNTVEPGRPQVTIYRMRIAC